VGRAKGGGELEVSREKNKEVVLARFKSLCRIGAAKEERSTAGIAACKFEGDWGQGGLNKHEHEHRAEDSISGDEEPRREGL